MSWRTVVVTGIAKLDFKMDYLVLRKKEETHKVHLSEIGMLLIESTAVSLTAMLLCELTKHKIKVVFCDEQHNPHSELLPYYGSHDTSAKIRKQIVWTDVEKELVWTEIVMEKIRQQSIHLQEVGAYEEAKLLEKYITEVEPDDASNREGHAAKVYFNALYGNSFVRNSDDQINAALNYGYAILLSAINKEIINNGYLTQLGIHHKNEFNEFNLTCDLMESFRIVIDNFVYYNQERKLDTEYKLDIVNILNGTFKYQGKNYTLKDIIKMFVKNTFESINNLDNYKEFVYHEE